MPTPFIFTDGFDVYGPPGITPAITTQWTTTAGTGTLTIVAGLSSTGYAARLFNNGNISKTLSASYSRIVGSIRFQCNLAGLTTISFMNGASTAFSFTFETTGVINLRTGTATGSIIAGGGAILANSTHVLSFDIAIGASGAYTVNLDGVLLYSGTGNTGNSQTSVNIIFPTIGSSSSQSLVLDDLVLIDPTQAGYNSAILTSNAVIETQFVSGDNQTQFANDGDLVVAAGVASNGVARANIATNAPGAGQLFLVKTTASVARTLQSVSVVPGATSGTAKFRAVVYSDSAGSPGSLLSSGNEVTGTTTGATLTGTLVTPQALAAGTSYWIGFITDTSVILQQYDAATNLGQKKANTYASGAPATGSGMTTGQATWLVWGNCTGASVNWPALAGNPPIATAASQTQSSTVGQEDLFTFPPLATNPSTIFGMAVKGLVLKTDAGARTASFNTKSGASDVTGSAPGQALATTPVWQGSYFETDPATGLAWTASGANSARGGVSVAT